MTASWWRGLDSSCPLETTLSINQSMSSTRKKTALLRRRNCMAYGMCHWRMHLRIEVTKSQWPMRIGEPVIHTKVHQCLGIEYARLLWPLIHPHHADYMMELGKQVRLLSWKNHPRYDCTHFDMTWYPDQLRNLIHWSCSASVLKKVMYQLYISVPFMCFDILTSPITRFCVPSFGWTHICWSHICLRHICWSHICWSHIFGCVSYVANVEKEPLKAVDCRISPKC